MDIVVPRRRGRCSSDPTSLILRVLSAWALQPGRTDSARSIEESFGLCEVRTACTECQYTSADHEGVQRHIHDMFAQFDTDGDGEISAAEFASIMKSTSLYE